MSMADAGKGSGGVSRVNLVGLDEYADTGCLSAAYNGSHLDDRVPAPTMTEPRATVMPDYTTSVASLTTTDGRVVTTTVVQTVKNGERLSQESDPAKKNAAIVGGAVGVGAIFGVALALVAWWFCRRRQKRRNTFLWDLPGGSEPFSANPNAPIHRSLHDGRGGAASGYPPGVYNRLSHVSSLHDSIHSLMSSFDHRAEASDHSHLPLMSAPTPPAATVSSSYSIRGGGVAGVAQPYSDISPPMADGQWATARGHGHEARSEYEIPAQEALAPVGASGEQGRRPMLRAFSSSDNSIHSNGSPTSTTMSKPSGRAGPGPTYRSPYAAAAATNTSADVRSSATAYEGMYDDAQMVPGMMPFGAHGQSISTSTSFNDPLTHNSAHTTFRGTSTSSGSFTPADTGTGTGSAGVGFVQHSDAGFLLDDSLDDEDVVDPHALVELPPQYDSITPSRRAGARVGGGIRRSALGLGDSGGSNVARNDAHGPEHVRGNKMPHAAAPVPETPSSAPTATAASSTPAANANDENENENEAEFWRSPPINPERT